MDFDKINNVAIRILGIVFCVFLVIGGGGACINHQYWKGAIGIVAAPVIVFIAFQPASLKTWVVMLLVFCLVMLIVGEIGN